MIILQSHTLGLKASSVFFFVPKLGDGSRYVYKRKYQLRSVILRCDTCLESRQKVLILSYWMQTEISIKYFKVMTIWCTYGSDDINNWCWAISLILVVLPCLLTHKGPQLVQVKGWSVVLVHGLVKVTHTYFTKVAWMAVMERQQCDLSRHKLY